MIFYRTFSSIRIQILSLTVLTLLPVVALIFYINIIQFNNSKEVEVNKLKNITNIIVSESSQITEGARQLLISLSVAPEIKYPPVFCSRYLFNLLAEYKRYDNFSVANSNGDVTCSAVQVKFPVNISDRYFFKETKRSNNFTVGEYVVSRITNESSINFGYPLKDNNGIVYATLSLDWLNNLIYELDVPRDYKILILDRKGKVLAGSPNSQDWVGKVFSGNSFDPVLNKNSGLIETSGIDGIKRLYSYKKVGLLDAGPFVAVGQTEAEIERIPLRDFKKFVSVSVIAALFSIAIGLLVGNYLIKKIFEKFNEIEGLKRDFVSLVSHQIRTPVTAIKWFSEILLSHSPGNLTKKQEDLLKDTHISAKRITDLIGILLDISKLESKQLPVNSEVIVISTLVKSVTKEIKIGFRSKKIKLNVKISDNIPQNIKADPKLIRQVFLNILHNAFKYSHTKGLVELEIRKQRNILLVKITDQGIGVPQAERAMLFQKFQRASNARIKDTEGAGLGLYLAKLIVEAHEGKIGLIKIKKGTSLYFTIPLT